VISLLCSQTSPRGLAVTDAAKWVLVLHAVCPRPTTHVRSTSACIPTQIFRQAAPFGLCSVVRECLSGSARVALCRCLLACLPACLSPPAAAGQPLSRERASERCLQQPSPVRRLSVCLPNKSTDTLLASASLPRRHPSSHPAKALHLTSTDCPGALRRDVYESKLDPVSVCHPTPQSALIVAVQTLLTSTRRVSSRATVQPTASYLANTAIRGSRRRQQPSQLPAYPCLALARRLLQPRC
jgi:hypothetical protein